MSESVTASPGDDAGAGPALVVGGSGAIGKAVCERLAVLGFDVVPTYASNRTAAEKTAASVREIGRAAESVQLRLEEPDEVHRTVADVVRRHGGINSVVLAASPTNTQTYVSKLSGQHYLEQLASDAGGTFNVVTAALPALRASRGSIVVVSTVANRRFVPRDLLSSAPKAANEALVRAVAVEEGRYGVRANAVGVGILDEGMTVELINNGDIRPGDLEHALARIPLKSFGKAADIAAAVGFFTSEQARYITGQWVDVDGGYGL